MKDLKNILVAVDFNDVVGDLMGYAESLAEKFDAKLWLVHVTAPSPDNIGPEPAPQYLRDFKAEELKDEHRNLQNLCDIFLDKSIAVDALLIIGSTVETVLEEAEKLNCDLLITGTHKHGFFHNLLSENVSLDLFKKSRIPLLTIPIDEE
ncbi:MAG TPA: universal stress protein [Salinimicrobium sp.]|nr:universal stress protein [Salinimicrobium sp.]